MKFLQNWRGAAEEEEEAVEMDAMEENGDTFEETIHHHFDIVEPSSSRLEILSYIRSGKRKMYIVFGCFSHFDISSYVNIYKLMMLLYI